MKLYLSSYRIPDLSALVELVGKQPSATQVAIIPNAEDYFAPRARRVKTREIEDVLRQLGFKVQVVDLHEYKNAAKLGQKLYQFDLLWVMGGNTFCLREAMARSGFDKIIAEVLRQGVVYAGESAGACVAGTDLHGIELADNPEFAETVVWEGLNLTPHYLVPHADNPKYGPIMASLMASRQPDPSLVVLNDNQAFVVEGKTTRVVTAAPAPGSSNAGAQP